MRSIVEIAFDPSSFELGRFESKGTCHAQVAYLGFQFDLRVRTEKSYGDRSVEAGEPANDSRNDGKQEEAQCCDEQRFCE